MEFYYVPILYVLFLFIMIIAIHKIINSMFVPIKKPVYYHPFDKWWRTDKIPPWYQDYLFDEKRKDNLFPSYQNI